MIDSVDDEAKWQTSMAALLRAVAATPHVVPPIELQPGSLVCEHFRIERQLGVGGMGVVYLAHDERLHRYVALKLHTRMADEHGTGRMIREAAAMAQLNHPNVLSIHEVGMIDDHMFIAMEFVDGQTLREWLGEHPRSWKEIRDVMMAAGEGLAAAHAADLVHRDFKPENILRAKTGLVCVADFGLARTAEDDANQGNVTSAAAELDNPLTRTGMIMGTPAYMAPEQYDSAQVDARADQFAFCVTLYEALYGHRPFAGASLIELIDEITKGNVQPPPTQTEVPRWLHEVTTRGLAAAPSARYADMPELLRELGKDPARKRRRVFMSVAAVTALVAVIAVVFVAARSSVANTQTDPCNGGDKRIASVWNKTRQARLQRSLSTAAPQLSNWPALQRTMGSYAKKWAAIHRDACEAAEVARSQPKAVMDKRFACLDRALVAFDGLISTFETADLVGAERALESTYLLPALEPCSDLDLLRRSPTATSDKQSQAVIATLRRSLFKTKVLMLNGQTDAALRLVTEIERDGQRIRGGLIMAEILIRKSQVLAIMGRNAEAEKHLKTAYNASRLVSDGRMAGTAAALMIPVASSHSDWKIADQWADLARIELPNAGYRSTAAALIQHNIASLRTQQSRHSDALGHLRAALRIEQHLYGNKHLNIADTRVLLASTLDALGKRPEAKQELRKAMALAAQLAGTHHPINATMLLTLALIHNGAGEHKRAVSAADRAITLRRQAYGDDHLQVAYAWQDHGVALSGLGAIDRAITSYQNALAILRKQLGDTHSDVGAILTNLGVAYERKGQLEKSVDHHRRALKIIEAQFGKDHYDVALARTNLGVSLLKQRHFLRAVPYFRRAIAIFAGANANDPTLVVPLNSIGVALVELRRAAEAIPLLERALALGDKLKVQPSRRARSRLNLANALWWSSKDKSRAITLMGQAQTMYAQLGSTQKHLRQYCEQWLDKRHPTWRKSLAATP